MQSLSLIVSLLEKVSLVLLVLYLASRTRPFGQVLQKDFNAGNRVVLIIVFAALSIYGTYSGVKLESGAIVNIREMAPMAAGLVGGPIVGFAVGLVGGIHRYTLGGLTALPCGISTTLAGLAAGLVLYGNKGKLISVRAAVLFAVLIEAAAMGIILLIARPFSQALDAVRVIAVPMISVNAIGVAVFVFMMRNVTREKYL